MTIILNNREEAFEAEKMTVSDLLKIKNFTFKMLVVRINGKVVRKHEYAAAEIKDGDTVEVLHLISGG
jgi:sulfur carrier protein